jgi:aminoacylase
VNSRGATGHGSRFIEPTAIEQIINVSKRALDFRKDQKDLLFGEGKHAGCSHAVAASKKKTIGDVTSLNITVMKAGVDAGNGVMCKNMVPPTASAIFDIRISPNMEPVEMKANLDSWCQECSLPGGELSWKFYDDSNNMMKHHTTPIGDEWPWFKRFKDGVALSGIDIVPAIFPAATDSRFLRSLGIRALGFSPMRNSEILLHEYNEKLGLDVYEEGIQVYVKLIGFLASADDNF